MRQIIVILLTLINAATSLASADLQPPVLDTDGNPLVRNGEYYIMPALPGSGGPWLVKNLTDWHCPVYLAQLNATPGDGTDFLAARFSPFDGDDNFVRLHTNVMPRFPGAQCGRPLTWKVEVGLLFFGERRWIAMDMDQTGFFLNYFKIKKREGFENQYVFYWCPLDICQDPQCFICSSLGLEVLQGTRLFALDGLRRDFPYATDFPVVFQRVYYNNAKY